MNADEGQDADDRRNGNSHRHAFWEIALASTLDLVPSIFHKTNLGTSGYSEDQREHKTVDAARALGYICRRNACRTGGIAAAESTSTAVAGHSSAMASLVSELGRYAAKLAKTLPTAVGGSVSAREGGAAWFFDMNDFLEAPERADACLIDLKSGRRLRGRKNPGHEAGMHLAVYLERPDVAAVFHTHPPWLLGVISCGRELKPMFAEFVNDLGRTASVPYRVPGSKALLRQLSGCARRYDTIFMANHGLLATGANPKQAFFRCAVAEDAAKSFVAASAAGRPRFLDRAQINTILSLDAVKHRSKMMEKK